MALPEGPCADNPHTWWIQLWIRVTRYPGSPDQASATAAANEYLDYVYEQNLQPGVVAIPDAFYFNNKKIKSFPMDKAAAANLNSLWNLELK